MMQVTPGRSYFWRTVVKKVIKRIERGIQVFLYVYTNVVVKDLKVHMQLSESSSLLLCMIYNKKFKYMYIQRLMITRGLCIPLAENITLRLGILMCCSQQNNNDACHRNPIILFHPTLWTYSTTVLTQTDSTAQPLPTTVPLLLSPI